VGLNVKRRLKIYELVCEKSLPEKTSVQDSHISLQTQQRLAVKCGYYGS